MTHPAASLTDRLRYEIDTTGPISVSRFMQTCLFDDRDGYYHKGAAIGASGDFITAPEVSQIFGEMLAAMLAYIAPYFAGSEAAICFEAGPGRGTLAADMQRGYEMCGSALAKRPLYVLEKSDGFRDQQKARLSEAPLVMIEDMAALPATPLFGVANEFFDALGVDQIIWQNGQWHHRLVGLSGEEFAFVTGPVCTAADLIPYAPLPEAPAEGDICETSPQSAAIMAQMAQHIAHHGGALLVIDYGKSDQLGDTLQAVANHRPVPPLSECGTADITHWVDFRQLAQVAEAAQARLIGPVPQGRFLLELGIAERAEALRRPDMPEQDRQLLAAIDRLVSPAQMGHAFKVALLVPQGDGVPPGFASYQTEEGG